MLSWYFLVVSQVQKRWRSYLLVQVSVWDTVCITASNITIAPWLLRGRQERSRGGMLHYNVHWKCNGTLKGQFTDYFSVLVLQTSLVLRLGGERNYIWIHLLTWSILLMQNMTSRLQRYSTLSTIGIKGVVITLYGKRLRGHRLYNSHDSEQLHFVFTEHNNQHRLQNTPSVLLNCSMLFRFTESSKISFLPVRPLKMYAFPVNVCWQSAWTRQFVLFAAFKTAAENRLHWFSSSYVTLASHFWFSQSLQLKSIK